MNLQRESASLNIPAPQDPALKMPGASAAAPVARAAKQQTTVAPEVNASAQSVNLATIAPTTEPELKMPAAPASAASARVRRPQDVAAPDVAGAAPNASLAGIAPASEPKLQIPVAPAAAAAARTRHQQETAAPIVDVSSEELPATCAVSSRCPRRLRRPHRK